MVSMNIHAAASIRENQTVFTGEDKAVEVNYVYYSTSAGH